MTRQRINLLSGFLAIVAGASIFWLTSGMPSASAGFPRMIGIGFAICGAILMIRAVLSGELAAAPEPTVEATGQSGLTMTLLVLWLAMLYAASWFGFVIPGLVFLAVAAWMLLGRPVDRNELIRIAGFAIGMTFGLWLIFVKFLGVEAPGMFGF